MVSGQQIPEACIKNFVIVLRLAVHIPALRGIGFEDLKSRIPKCLSSFYFVNIYFNIFFQERFIYLKKFYFLVFTKFYLFFLSRSRLWWNRMNINKGAFFFAIYLQWTFELWSVPLLHVMRFFFLCLRLGLSPMWNNLEDLQIGFESFLAGVSPRRYASKVYDCVNSDGSSIKLDT